MKYPVLLPNIFGHPFTYNSKKKLDIGQYVKVPFGKAQMTGLIWHKFQEDTKKKFQIKNILEEINTPKLNEKTLKFLEWFSEYNMVPLGMSLKLHLLSNEAIGEFDKKVYGHFLSNKIPKDFRFSKEQMESIKKMENKTHGFRVHLLQGTTGSGKTLVYFNSVMEKVKNGLQALILLPEIGLTLEFEKKFEEFFGFNPAIWHSGISKKKKKIIWSGLATGEIKVVIGARSSLFLPFKNLGLIVVDEEHDTSYKQDEGIRYNARDMAISRASIENIPLLLSTSIPSLETYNNVKNKKYNLTTLKKRYKDFSLPNTKIINLSLNKKKKNIWLDNKTLDLAKDYLAKGDQVLFFVNRRGYAPFVICKNCGIKLKCPNCSIFLTFHKFINKAMCHHCGHKADIKKKCDKTEINCEFQMYGPGVEKIFSELKQIFPKKIIKILSSDFLNKKKETKNLLSDIEKNKINILVGTQLISKGFNFPNLNCIVVVDADFSGMGFDLRSNEKNIQLYNQLSGRAGRFSKDSLIIYQTFDPSDKTLNCLLENQQERFFEEEIYLREQKKLPPFTRLIAFIISSNNQDESYLEAQKIKKSLSDLSDVDVMGPVSSPIFKIKNKYRTRLLLRSKANILIQRNVSKILKKINISKKIKLTVDVDPLNFS